uniref:PDZ domain containing 1 n=1 Tax=Amphilophus citrinellus TaxID=61819 RepID=A0A3Q0QNK7_AMPCI
MAGYKPRVISLTKKPNQTFGFYLRLEGGEEGHLIRSLEMGGPAERAGMKDGDRILRVNGTFVDERPHSEVVDLVKSSGTSVTFHILDESSYKRAKAQGVNLSDPASRPVANGVEKHSLKPKLCYLVKSSSGFGFSIHSVNGEEGLFMTDVIPGGVADRAGIKLNDRLVEVNGENVENSTHDVVVGKIRLAGSNIMLLLVDEETDKFYQKKQVKIGSWIATTMYLPHQPRIINMTRGSDGYGFTLKELNQLGHFIRDIERGSPAEKAHLKEMDRLVAVDGREVSSCSHGEVVDKIKLSGNNCSLLVVDKDTDQMYKLVSQNACLFSKPCSQSEELRPKLCKLEKTSTGFGFHLNGVQGVYGHYIQKVVKGGAADKAGLEDDDIVVEVNGVNVEQSFHEDVVKIIQGSGNSLEMLVAKRSVYDKLKAKGVPITRQLLGETSYAQVHSADTPEASERETRPKTQTEPERQRNSSVSSSSSEESIDERL